MGQAPTVPKLKLGIHMSLQFVYLFSLSFSGGNGEFNHQPMVEEFIVERKDSLPWKEILEFPPRAEFQEKDIHTSGGNVRETLVIVVCSIIFPSLISFRNLYSDQFLPSLISFGNLYSCLFVSLYMILSVSTNRNTYWKIIVKIVRMCTLADDTLTYMRICYCLHHFFIFSYIIIAFPILVKPVFVLLS